MTSRQRHPAQIPALPGVILTLVGAGLLWIAPRLTAVDDALAEFGGDE